MIKYNSISKLHDEINSNKVNARNLFNDSVEMAKKYQDEYNSFVTILGDNYCDSDKDTLLNGIPYALKDNVSTKGILTTASSNILADYVPIYNATVYEKLLKSGAQLVGKTVMDELAMGGTGTTGHTGIVRNPLDKSRMIGGSSSGSAAAVSLGIVPFAIGSDTGDSIRKPAAYSGVVGYKPTYGRVSRYGIIPFASSLDHVGVLARNVEDVAIVMDIIKGHDDKDLTSLKDENINYVDVVNDAIAGRKLFYIKEMLEIKTDNENINKVIGMFKENISRFRKMGFEVVPESIDKDLLLSVGPCYTVISSAEATSNHANLTGILFGLKSNKDNIQDMMMETRTKGFSFLIKRRFVLGSYVLQRDNQEKLFRNACRIRRVLVDKLSDLFKVYDGLILPTSFNIAPKFSDKIDTANDEYLMLENHLDLANFGGFPSISIPCGNVNNMPIGLSITGRIKEDTLVLNMAYQMEKVLKGDDTNV